MTPLNGAKPIVREYTDANGLRVKIAIDEVGVWFCQTGFKTWKMATLQELFDMAIGRFIEIDGKEKQAKPGEYKIPPADMKTETEETP